MKNTIILLVLSVLFFNCKSVFYNSYLERIGVYNDVIKLQKITIKDKQIVFFPIAHLGTKLFYKDVKSKIDSLKTEGYYFYYEKVKVDIIDTLIFRKFRKVSKAPYYKNGYVGMIDSTIKLKLKKELINQPSYKDLGLDSINSKNVDVFLEEMINYYEDNFDRIILEPCDFETTIFEESICENKKEDKIFKEEVILQYRNNHVVMEVEKNRYEKIAIIYGSLHIPGIKQELLSKGYN